MASFIFIVNVSQQPQRLKISWIVLNLEYSFKLLMFKLRYRNYYKLLGN